MKKRILSLLLVFVLVTGLFLPRAFASNTDHIPAEASAEICEICTQPECGLNHVYCEICLVYDCKLDHAPVQPLSETEPLAGDIPEQTPVCPDCGKEICECESDAELCPDCGKEVCECESDAELCPDCGKEICECESDAELCPDCGKEVCECESDAELCPDCGKEICECESDAELCPDCGKEVCECKSDAELCPDCGKEVCECETDAELCPDCGKEICECESDAELCPDCGKEVCECESEEELSVWDRVGEPEAISLIGYLNKNNANIVFYNMLHQSKSVAAADCPDFLILTECYRDKESGEALIYRADSADDKFFFDTLSSNPYVEAQYFSSEIPAAGQYVKLKAGEDSHILYKDLSRATDTVSLAPVELAGEYMVEELYYEPSMSYWYLKLTPDENWPAKAEGYVWIAISSAASFSATAAPKPENHDCDCGSTEAVQHHDMDCKLYKFWVQTYVQEQSVEEISAKWKELDKASRESILAILRDNAPEKLDALRPLLPDMGIKLEESIDGVAVTMQGDIPADVTLKLARLAEDKYSNDILAIATEAYPVYFALDVSPTLPDGSKWQPYEGESVELTIDARALNLDDGIPVRLFNDHEGKLVELGTSGVADGMLKFKMSAFSTVYGLATRAASLNSLDNVVYLDLNAGNITITDSSYSGFRFDGMDEPQAVTGTLEEGQSYYIYQSNDTNKSQTGIVTTNGTAEIKLPEYTRVSGWADTIFGENNVQSVINGWESAVASTGRTATENYAVFTGSMNCSVVIDNLWSSYQPMESKSNSSKLAAFKFVPASGATLTINFKGDNRFGKIYYLAAKNSGAEIIFDGEENATLTVANNPDKDGYNYWKSAIGADDSSQDSDGIVIRSGNIYAGTTAADDCTAIGGGGNGYGGVTINGGNVTAVCASSGAAIGAALVNHQTADRLMLLSMAAIYMPTITPAYPENILIK